MIDYRLYFFAGDGRITRSVPFQCDSEQEAIAFACSQASLTAAELWNGLRRVIGFGARR